METLIKFKTFVDEINAENGKLYKMKVLEKYKEDEDIKYYLNFIFNPYITTGISKKKISKDMSDIINSPWGTGVIEFDTVKDLLEHIKVYNTGTTDTLAAIQNFRETAITDFSSDDIDLLNELDELLENIITKNVQLGVDVITINKVIPNLIPTFDVMLANKYYEKPDYVVGKLFCLTTKIDGGRIVAIKKDGVVEFFTRAGQKYEGLVDLEREMASNMPDNIALDGEITLLHGEGLDNKAQYKQTMMITRRDGEKHGVKMKVFDILSADEFVNQVCYTRYIDRRARLDNLFDAHNFTYFEKLPILYEGYDVSKIEEILQEQINNGEEGVMINIADALYEFKRTNNLLKVKKFHSCDLEVIGLEEGTNKNKNTLGAFICSYKGNTVKVGSGISEAQRREVWNNQEKYLNTIIEVCYFEETINQDGKASLRFPTFKDFRPDKNTFNY